MRRHGTVGKNSAIVAVETQEVAVHTFRRALDPEAVRLLIAVFVFHGTEFVEISHFFSTHAPGVTTARGGLFPRLRWWGFIEVQRNEAGEEIQGFWRVTPQGAAFVTGSLKIGRYVDEKRAEVVRAPYGELCGVQRFAGWLYSFDTARTVMLRLASRKENILRYFDTQWQDRQRA